MRERRKSKRILAERRGDEKERRRGVVKGREERGRSVESGGRMERGLGWG